MRLPGSDTPCHKGIREPSKQKMSQIVEKVHNFLDPRPQDNLDYFEFGGKLVFDDPRPKLGEN